MKHFFYTLSAIAMLYSGVSIGQTAAVYRGSTLVGTYSTLTAASVAANTIGDSIVLSAHTFKEHNVPMQGGQTWSGTVSGKDTTTIDAEKKGRVGGSISKYDRALVLRNIICINGETNAVTGPDAGGIQCGIDSLVLKGFTVIRNCHAEHIGGACYNAYMYDHSRLIQNSCDTFGGAAGWIMAFDHAEIAYNTARYGGAVGSDSSLSSFGGFLITSSDKVKVHHNTAAQSGGAIFGYLNMFEPGAQIINNQAPLGAAIYSPDDNYNFLNNARIHNPDVSGNFQNEIFMHGGALHLGGTWFGKSDTADLIETGIGGSANGNYAIASWSVNNGKVPGVNDTLFPVSAALINNDGSPLPLNSCPWLKGSFRTTLGDFLTPSPVIGSNDTISSLFRTYEYASGESGSKPISYTCIIDKDTFRTTELIWGRTKLGIGGYAAGKNILIYPNPAKDWLIVSGAAADSRIALYDMKGMQVVLVTATEEKVSLSVAHLPAGNYIMKITDPGGMEGTSKIIKY